VLRTILRFRAEIPVQQEGGAVFSVLSFRDTFARIKRRRRHTTLYAIFVARNRSNNVRDSTCLLLAADGL